MRKVFIFLVFTGLLMLACSKKKTEYKTLYYKQTFCADAWGYDTVSNQNQVNKVINYLEANNLYYASVFYYPKFQPDSCKACTCKTGKVIEVTTFSNTETVQQYKNIGFVE